MFSAIFVEAWFSRRHHHLWEMIDCLFVFVSAVCVRAVLRFCIVQLFIFSLIVKNRSFLIACGIDSPERPCVIAS